MREEKTENRALITDNRDPRAENREQRTENGEPKTEIGSRLSVFSFRFSVLCFLFSVFCSLPLFSSTSLSDLAPELLDKELTLPGARNPFAPSEVSGQIDIESLSLEGLLIGEKLKLGLVSGKIIQSGTNLGPYTVKEIASSEVVLEKNGEEQRLKLEGYLAPLKNNEGSGFHVEFRNADIRDALRFLSKAEGLNLIMPEDLSGRVNLSFTRISLLNVLRSILKVNNYSFAVENGIMRVGKLDDFKGGTDLLATTFALKYAKAKDLIEQVKLLLSDKGSVAAEERTNILSVKDFDANVDNVRQFLAKVDGKDDQVMIEARIVDATNDFSRSLGVQWGISGMPDRLTISGADSTGTLRVGANPATPAIVNVGATSPTGGVAFRVGRIPGATNIDLQLTAAEQRGDIHIISKPSVTTINNQAATIRSGVTLYVKSTSNISIGAPAAGAGASQPSLQMIKTGIQLDVTPQITPNDYIKLNIDTTESEADFSRTVDGIPAILDNKATTTVLLKDGETAVIGGLIKKRDSTNRRGVPGLSKIPGLGIFFKSKTDTKTQNELMVFITPRILK